MTTPSSRHLSHDFPAYKGLTLRELMVLVAITTAVMTLTFLIIGLLFRFPGAFGCTGFVLGFIVGVSFAPKPISRLKAGKPYGYLKKRVRINLASWGFVRPPYLAHVGLWHTLKRLGVRRV